MAVYLLYNNEKYGPYEESMVAEWLMSGRCSPNDLAWREGMENWRPLSNFHLTPLNTFHLTSDGALDFHDRASYMETIVVGCYFALVALLPSYLILSTTSLQELIFASVAAAFFVGMILWRKAFTRGRRPTFWRGVTVGVLVGTLSHPLAWYLAMLWAYLSGARGSLGDRTIDPLNGLWASIAYSALSLVVVGWITAPVGGAAGGVLGFIAGKRWQKSAGLRGPS